MVSVAGIKDYVVSILGTGLRVASKPGPERVKGYEVKGYIGFVSRSGRGRPSAEYSP